MDSQRGRKATANFLCRGKGVYDRTRATDNAICFPTHPRSPKAVMISLICI